MCTQYVMFVSAVHGCVPVGKREKDKPALEHIHIWNGSYHLHHYGGSRDSRGKKIFFL